MELCALPQLLHTWGGSVEAYLVYGILPLDFGLGIRVLHSQVFNSMM